jgi:KDO2-lipid IV(A) lauroyltransferase
MHDEREQKQLKPLLRALALLLGSLIVAMLVAPWVYRATQAIPWLRDASFLRAFGFVALGTIAVALTLARNWMCLSLSARASALLTRRRASAQCLSWMVPGMMLVLAIAAAQRVAGSHVGHQRTPIAILQAALIGLATAAALALLEEYIFRGHVLHAFLQYTGRYAAILASSAVFALVHLLVPSPFSRSLQDLPLEGTRWNAGLDLLSVSLESLSTPNAILPGSIGLLLFGWLSAELTVRTRTLWSAIGLHTGMAWAAQYSGYLLQSVEPPPGDASANWWYGGHDATTGALAWIVMLGGILVVNGLLAYAIYRPTAAVIGLLSHGAVVRLGRFAGKFAYRFCRRQRRVALDNLRHAFPDKTPEEREAIARECFGTACTVILEMLSCKTLLRDYHELVTVQGFEHVEAAQKAGKPVLFFTGHLASWEALLLICGVLKLPFTVVARPIANEWIYRHIARTRRRSGVALFDKHDITRDVLRVLRAKEMIGFAGDQYAGSDGIFVQFFGRPASTSPAMALFARRTGAVIIPAFDHFEPDNTHAPVIHPGFEVAHTEDAQRDLFEATQRMMTLLEQEIRKTPGQWLWMHRKWRPRRAPATSRSRALSSKAC